MAPAAPAAADRDHPATARLLEGPIAGFRRLASVTLVYTLLVILFGAVVRITGSGAGCGQHWPTCQGQVVPLSPAAETVIEFSHRLTSGLAFVLVVVLALLARSRFATRHPARRAAFAALGFMFVEALIGAALVLFGLVGENDSAARAVVMAAHLLSTCLLTAALVLARAFAAPAEAGVRLVVTRRLVLSLLGLLGVVLVSATGAVTALGDTLYPVSGGTMPDRLVADPALGTHFLKRLRGLHPLLAIAVAGYLIALALRVRRSAGAGALKRAAGWVLVLAAVQLLAGWVNVLLSAPGYLQVIHLGLALGVWLALVLFSLELVKQSASEGAPTEARAGRHSAAIAFGAPAPRSALARASRRSAALHSKRARPS